MMNSRVATDSIDPTRINFCIAQLLLSNGSQVRAVINEGINAWELCNLFGRWCPSEQMWSNMTVSKVSRGKRPVLPDSLPAELLSAYKSILDHHTHQGCLYLKGIPSSSSQNVKIIEIHRLCILTSAVHHYPMDGSMVCIVTKLIVPTMAGEYAKLFGFVKYTQTLKAWCMETVPIFST